MTASGLDLRVQPYKVAPNTHVIPQLLEAPPIGLVYVNSLVITGAEPVLVDTGAPPIASSGSRTPGTWSTRPTCAGCS
jgi:hypothetical protein